MDLAKATAGHMMDMDHMKDMVPWATMSKKKILKEDSYFINKFFRWHNFCLVYTLQSQMASMEAGVMKISILSKCNHKSNTSS